MMDVLDAGKANDRNYAYWADRVTATEILEVAKVDVRTVDYWVAVIEGVKHPSHLGEMRVGCVLVPVTVEDDGGYLTRYVAYSPSSDPKYAAPIIADERISLDTWQGNWGANYGRPVDCPDEDHNPGHHRQRASTFLEAAMRCYLAKNVGAVFYVLPGAKTLPYIESIERKRRSKEKNGNSDS
jgi:hypothetical protein